MNDVVFKLKHKPTGLYYQPNKARWAEDKSNLAVRGKIYTTKTFPKYDLPMSIFVSRTLELRYNIPNAEVNSLRERIISTSPGDWELEEYQLVKL